jgi:hypothetical protein
MEAEQKQGPAWRRSTTWRHSSLDPTAAASIRCRWARSAAVVGSNRWRQPSTKQWRGLLDLGATTLPRSRCSPFSLAAPPLLRRPCCSLLPLSLSLNQLSWEVLTPDFGKILCHD